MKTKPLTVSALRLDLIFDQRHTASAHCALDMVGRKVVPTTKSERVAHAYVIVEFPTGPELMFPHDLNLLPKTLDAAQINYASRKTLSHGETPLSDHPGGRDA